MALIKCPECQREISDKAPVCIHCGFPLSPNIKDTDNKMNLMFCEKCKIHYFPPHDSDNQVTICQNCGSTLLDTGLSYDDYKNLPKVKRCTKCKRKYPKIFIKCPKCYNQLTKESTIDQKQLKLINDMPNDNQPKCPNCGSTNVKKIGMAERGVSVAVFGLASDKIAKSMKCDNCGYKW